MLPTPVFWSGEFHGLYSPWGRKESDTTDFHLHFSNKPTVEWHFEGKWGKVNIDDIQ